MVQFTSAVLVAASLLFTSSRAQQVTKAAAAFLSSDKYFSFALNIPEDEPDSLHFTLQGTDTTWVAVGLGNNKMEDTLVFMAYSDASGKNVTLSPRLSYGNAEPAYTSNVTVEVLQGSGVINGTIKVNAKCKNCRSWKGGSIDPGSKEGKFIFASGPDGDLKSNSLSADVKRHSSHGAFVMDLTSAVGASYVPDNFTSSTAGSSETQNKIDRDFSGAGHAVLMVLAFVGFLPLGIMVLRVFKSPKWHGVIQAVSMTIALTGMAIGIWMGTKYNRTKNFNSAHQIIGIIVISAMVGQFILGFMYHKMYKQTQTPTKLAPIHVWLGRFVILLGVVNGFIGFPLALNPKYDLYLLGVVLFVLIIFGPFAFWRFKRNSNKQKLGSPNSGDVGYQSQPWVSNGASRTNIELNQMQYSGPPSYHNNQPPAQGRQFV